PPRAGPDCELPRHARILACPPGRLPGPIERRRSAALVHRDVIEAPSSGVDKWWAGDLLLDLVDHLEPLRDPATGASDREKVREHLDGNPERLVDQPRVEGD